MATPCAPPVDRFPPVPENLGVAPSQPLARYYLVGGSAPELPRHTLAELRRLLLIALEAGCPDDARDGHGEEEQP